MRRSMTLAAAVTLGSWWAVTPAQAESARDTCPTSWTMRDLPSYLAYSEQQDEDVFFESLGYEWPAIGAAIFAASDANEDGLICTKKAPVVAQGFPDFYDLRRDNSTSAM